MKDLKSDAKLDESGIYVIVNGGSGKVGAKERLALLQRWADEQLVPVHLHSFKRGENAVEVARQAAESGAGTVVAAGGDGTISAVAAALAGTAIKLGVLPQGTFNFFARGLNIPDDIDAALAVIAEGHTVHVAVGTVNNRVFLNNASIGAYPAILDQREGIYRRWGRSRLAAHWSVVQALLSVHRPHTMRVTVDGEVFRVRTPLAFVASSAFQLEQYGLDGADMIRSGKFALFLAEDCGRFKMLKFAAKLASRRLVAGRDFTLIGGKEIIVETSRQTSLVARDGEKERMSSPYHFSRHTAALQVLVPRESEAET